MKFISYSKNFEDIMLWRALNRYGPGFYIDVGASDPQVGSVTKAFYENRWRGINIAVKRLAVDCFREARPRDINLNLVIEKKTLTDICQEFVNQEIMFLKVSVKGGEKSVLEGADFQKHRPWIVLIEGAIPNSTTQSHEVWEQLLISSKYSFVYFDGLNRFYIANEKLSLLAKYFQSPPNCFDDFVKYDQVKAIESNALLEETLRKKEEEINSCYQELFESSRHIGVLSKELNNLKNLFESKVWKVAMMLRKFSRMCRR